MFLKHFKSSLKNSPDAFSELYVWNLYLLKDGIGIIFILIGTFLCMYTKSHVDRENKEKIEQEDQHE
jgi:hypothetical protein